MVHQTKDLVASTIDTMQALSGLLPTLQSVPATIQIANDENGYLFRRITSACYKKLAIDKLQYATGWVMLLIRQPEGNNG